MINDPKENMNAIANATHVIVFMMVYLSSIESIFFFFIINLYIFKCNVNLRLRRINFKRLSLYINNECVNGGLATARNYL
jgi:hypothetical protein